MKEKERISNIEALLKGCTLSDDGAAKLLLNINQCTKPRGTEGKKAETVHFETDQIDRMFLELAQFTTARTKDELKLDKINAIKAAADKVYDSSTAKSNTLQAIYGVLNA